MTHLLVIVIYEISLVHINRLESLQNGVVRAHIRGQNQRKRQLLDSFKPF